MVPDSELADRLVCTGALDNIQQSIRTAPLFISYISTPSADTTILFMLTRNLEQELENLSRAVTLAM